MAKFIFITGGVVSSLGKGLASASLGSLLQSRGYKVCLRKLDPYLNIDPGTMNPTQHGEVFVTEDGAETDLDLGHYERFADINCHQGDNVTAGRIYSNLLKKERKGEYLGGTVQVIPHVTNLIKEFARNREDEYDFILCEIGGTVGDIEALPFFEAIRQLGNDLGRDNAVFIHLTLVPYLAAAQELKTKPTQHSVKELRTIGIQPNIIMCRCDREIPRGELDKIALFCNVAAENVIPALDTNSIYRVPVNYHNDGLDRQVLKEFNIAERGRPNLSKWENILADIAASEGEITIGLVGKYVSLHDAYKSVAEALDHAGMQQHVKVKIKWIDCREADGEEVISQLQDVDGILVPGGFGDRGAAGKQAAIRYARENDIPFLGICFGMQMAVIEFARNVLGIKDAGSSENSENNTPIVGLMTEWDSETGTQVRSQGGDLGGTMRLGSYDCVLQAGSLAESVYGKADISERHRHRYEVNINYKQQLEEAGMQLSGLSPDGDLPEIIEIPANKYFIASQFHPEFKSRPAKPHPLFVGLVRAATKK